jgi:uncharacterized protein (TIGR00251 family)
VNAPCLQAVGGGCQLRVKAQPRAARTELAGLLGEELKIRVAAPPVDDAANEALTRFLADTLDLPRSQVRLVRGRSGGHKVFEFAGLTVAEAARRLGLAG